MRPLIDLAHRVRRRVLAILRWRTRGVKVMIHDPAGALLLVRHRYGRSDLWMLPGGGIDRRESPIEAARREVMEELDCTLRDLTPVASYQAAAEGRRDTVHLFRATTSDMPRVDPIELAEARFFALDALPDAVSPATRRRIDEAAGRRAITMLW